MGIKTAQQASPPNLLFIAFEVQKPRAYPCHSPALQPQQWKADLSAKGKVGNTNGPKLCKISPPPACEMLLIHAGLRQGHPSPLSLSHLPRARLGAASLRCSACSEDPSSEPGTFNRYRSAVHSRCSLVVRQDGWPCQGM